ncbi:putative pentatricopeptide repeat-containing protein At3g23330 [Typha angustifolia]|uniref:putative pentatricopeptide repeat-containing protein At3g23330 n=1 Tax=Typha angustifolia TaxID=59011 RepID=UPI003C2DD491
MLPSSTSSLLSYLSSQPTSNVLLYNSLLASLARAGHFRRALSFFRSHMLPHLLPDHFTLAILSKSAAELADPFAGSTLHSLAVRLGFISDVVLCNSLVLLYSSCGLRQSARQLFNDMPMRTTASWNLLISQFSKLGSCYNDGEVWNLLRNMQMDGLKPDGFTVSVVLPLYDGGNAGQLRGREMHGYVVRNELGLASSFHVGSCLIDMYCRGGRVDLGRQIFDSMMVRNLVIWTTMIGGYVENEEFKEALRLFHDMQVRDGIVPNRVTLISILPGIGSLSNLAKGKQIHGYSFRMGLSKEVSLNNALVDMYSKCGSLMYARRVFDNGSWQKDAISWSSMIASYGIHGEGEEAVVLFLEMCGLGIKPDNMIGLAVLSACSRAGLVVKGLEIYNLLVKDHEVLPTVEMCSCMVDLLGRAGLLNHALDFIKSMTVVPTPSVWGALFDASIMHNNQEMQEVAYKSLLQLEQQNPSNFVSLSNLNASSGRWDIVEQVRRRMKEKGLRKMPGCSWINVNSMKSSLY